MTDDEAKKVLHKLSGRYFVGDRVRLFAGFGWSVEGVVLKVVAGEVQVIDPDWETARGRAGGTFRPIYALFDDTFELISRSETSAK